MCSPKKLALPCRRFMNQLYATLSKKEASAQKHGSKCKLTLDSNINNSDTVSNRHLKLKHISPYIWNNTHTTFQRRVDQRRKMQILSMRFFLLLADFIPRVRMSCSVLSNVKHIKDNFLVLNPTYCLDWEVNILSCYHYSTVNKTWDHHKRSLDWWRKLMQPLLLSVNCHWSFFKW